MLFTRAGLEQATRLAVAARHAGAVPRRRDRRRVADLGCGIGGDALGFAALGLRVEAVDADEVTAAIAAYNLAPFGDAVTVRHGSAEAIRSVRASTRCGSIPRAARRATARPRACGPRTTRRRSTGRSSSPARIPTGIKLGPGLDRAMIPDDVEAQWVSADGSTVELVLWSGALARDGVRRAALVMRGDARVGADLGGGCRGRAGPSARRVRARARRRGDPRAPDRRRRPRRSRRACSPSRSPT